MEDLELNQKQILIIDDEPDLLEIISSEFELEGANVFQADSVEKAISVLSNNPIDIVISDVRMPFRTGIDLLKYIKDKNAFYPPMILISGYTDVPIQDIYDLGAEGFLVKPFRLEDLILLTSRLLKNNGPNWPLFDSNNMTEFIFEINNNLKDAVQNNVFALGRGGCAFYLSNSLHKTQINREINFSIQLMDKILKGSGAIRWVEHGINSNRTQIGIEFRALDSESQKFFKDYLVNNKTIPYIPHFK
jgi:DNA-binding response OmpR family regulator